MALIRTLTISTTTFERMKGKFYGFRQTVLADHSRSNHELGNLGKSFAINFLFLNSDKIDIQMCIIMYYTVEVHLGASCIPRSIILLKTSFCRFYQLLNPTVDERDSYLNNCQTGGYQLTLKIQDN